MPFIQTLILTFFHALCVRVQFVCSFFMIVYALLPFGALNNADYLSSRIIAV